MGGIDTNGVNGHGEQPAVWLLTWPRTASHLFEKILSLQPGVKLIEHPAMKTRLSTQETIMTKLHNGSATEEDRQALKDLMQGGYDLTLKALDETRAEGLRPFVHEHISFMLDPDLARIGMAPVPSNEIPTPDSYWTPLDPNQTTPSPRTSTLLYPDSFLTTRMVPVIPIRNPALSFPSIFRAMTTVGGVPADAPHLRKWMTLRSTRQTYEWLVAHSAPNCQPLLVEADDVMHEGAERDSIMDKLYAHIGFTHPPQWNWEQESDEKLKAKGVKDGPAKIKESVYKSTGIVAGKSSKGLNLDEAYGKWVEEFGEAPAKMIWGCVEANMEHYHFLTERKLKAE